MCCTTQIGNWNKLLQVMDMDEIMKPKLEEERTRVVETARQEALESAIAQVKQKVEEQLEQDRIAKKKAAGIHKTSFFRALSSLVLRQQSLKDEYTLRGFSLDLCNKSVRDRLQVKYLMHNRVTMHCLTQTFSVSENQNLCHTYVEHMFTTSVHRTVYETQQIAES